MRRFARRAVGRRSCEAFFRMRRCVPSKGKATSRRISITFLAGVFLCLGSMGCGRSQPPPKPRDVLLISIDTARADRFSYTGATVPGTPRIDALARQGVGFSNAISPAPLTKPAHASLLTGRLPPSHTVRDNGAYRLPDAETTLAEELRRAGFTTGAFIGAQVLDARYGFNQGFDTYDDRIAESGDQRFLMYAERTGEEVVAAATRWLETQRDGPVFAWVHLFDPHTPYRPPEPERSRYASPYDGEIAYVDRVVGQLLDAWESRRGLERTLVVVTSDHGEALGEHGEASHGVLVHDATLRVPLVIRAPGLHVEGNVTAPVSLIDVMPTVLALLNLPCPPDVQGRDLGPELRGETVPWLRTAGYAESLYAQLHHGCAPLLALREGGWKIVRGRVDELYDLTKDPGESQDVASREPDRSAKLATALEELTADIKGGAGETALLDDEARRALESLGYVWAAGSSAARGGTARDPREALRSMKQMADADRSLLRGDVEGAIAGYHAVIDSEPASVDPRIRLAQILIAQQRHADAYELLVAAVAIAPQEPFLHQKLGETLEALGRNEAALAAFDAGVARHPDARELRNGRWRCLNQLGRQEVMLAEAQRAVERDPSDGMARYARAMGCCSRGSIGAFLAALERELAALPGDKILENAVAGARAEAAGQGARSRGSR